MDRFFFSILVPAMQWARPQYNARLHLLVAQISILRTRIDTSRIVPTPKGKAELLRIGGQRGHDVPDYMQIVLPETYRKWIRQAGKEIPFKASGRPRTRKATIDFVLRIANENTRRGYRKVVGKLKKLSI